MKWWLAVLVVTLASAFLHAEEELPQPDNSLPLEIEPPILIPSRNPDGTPNLPTPPEQVDIVKVEKDIERAKRNAASGERMFRAGIISKVESEERALKVVRLEAKLAEARLQAARQLLSEQKDQAQLVEIEAQLRARESQVSEAEREAELAAEERQRAELEAAVRNLARQQKLLALGSGRRADVNRAEKKLAELQSAKN